MTLNWLVRDNVLKNHQIFGDEHFGTKPPCTTFEKKPVTDPHGKVIDGLYVAWVTLNNPDQFNSYTTEMVKGVIAGMNKASMDREIQAVVFTGAGDRAFCSGGNVKEYAEYYTKRPKEYADYIELFSFMVDSILRCHKPVICRANGMRIAGGQEIGQATDFTIAADTANFGQAGTRHGSTPDGGSTDFLCLAMPTIEMAMWQCVSNEQWSAYKMKRLGAILDAVPIKKDKNGSWVRNPMVITDKYVDNGEIVYGEFKTGEDAGKAKSLLKELTTDFTLLDQKVNETIWHLVNLMPMCLMKATETVRIKKRAFWDNNKVSAIYWLGANMNMEASLGFPAFNSSKETGTTTIDFIKYRQLLAQGKLFDEELMEAVLAKPKK
jgi:6-oxocyclohex-1-ene-carbonyl-CoA hydrolase